MAGAPYAYRPMIRRRPSPTPRPDHQRQWAGSFAVAVAGVAALFIPGRRRTAEAGEEGAGTAPARVLETASH
ncbi:hypothetical protein [Streptomyces sp. NPDC050704]|uniref:hypothetical protein n=1 Tax=Streptomyces sp. NPDC050704 TaxID=3157219 RepID=UPI0034254BA7